MMENDPDLLRAAGRWYSETHRRWAGFFQIGETPMAFARLFSTLEKEKLTALQEQLAALQKELRDVRAENDALRKGLREALKMTDAIGDTLADLRGKLKLQSGIFGGRGL